jgi:methionyl aminopeptidase
VVTNGFGIIREYVGHGIGTQLHEEPQVPNYVDRNHENPRLKEGMVLAIEPMISAGKPDTKVGSDKWTAKTKDGSYSAHFEHCVAVTADGPWVLTRP